MTTWLQIEETFKSHCTLQAPTKNVVTRRYQKRAISQPKRTTQRQHANKNVNKNRDHVNVVNTVNITNIDKSEVFIYLPWNYRSFPKSATTRRPLKPTTTTRKRLTTTTSQADTTVVNDQPTTFSIITEQDTTISSTVAGPETTLVFTSVETETKSITPYTTLSSTNGVTSMARPVPVSKQWIGITIEQNVFTYGDSRLNRKTF